MKKVLYLILLLSAFTAQAQQNVAFKIKYLPNHSYDGTVTLGMVFHVNLSGDSAIISKIASQGITQPIAMNMNMKMSGNTKTGAVAAGQMFPITIKYKFDDMTAELNGNSVPIPTDKLGEGVSIYGHAGANGRIQADSIGGKKNADTSQENVKKLMNAIQKEIKYPDHPMQIGETFNQDMPMNIPVAGNNIDMDAKSVYKLVSIANGNAYFDVQQSMNMTIPVAGVTITIVGTGTGKLVYSIKDNFATDFSSNLSLKVNGNVKKLLIDATAQINAEYKYTIN